MNGEILQDYSTTGKLRPWREHKIGNELLAKAYDVVNPDKAERLRECGNQLDFEIMEDGTKKLVGMWSCRVRLCPLCSWRRSLKVGAQMRQIITEMETEREYSYILLTLTVKNCSPDRLNSTINDLMSAFQRLIERKQVADILEGWYRSLEVTHDLDPYITKERLQNAKAYYKRLGLKTGDVNPNYDTFHPHFHCLLAVKSSYFSGQRYIKQAEWARLWKESLRIDYDPSVDVRRVKEDKAGAIAEVAKYAAKAGDYIIPDDWELTIETVKLLDKALHKRRLIAYGGVFKEIHKKLHLDSEEDGDLVHVDGERPEKPQGRVVHFLWYSGYRQYKSETQGF